MIIPRPASLQASAGRFQITARTAICADEANRANAGYLRSRLHAPSGLPLPILYDPPPGDQRIELRLSPEDGPSESEAYRLAINPQGIVIQSPSPRGIFWGIQSLRQLLPVTIEDRALDPGIPWDLPALTINDQPRFAWRGLMLDEGRHFQGKQNVLRILELMALHKLNVFHWHLTDDQGWRIEIEQYPRLQQVASRRSGTAPALLRRANQAAYHGCYTQQEIAEIVAFAATRHISVVPEIEMPGHSLAALCAYPGLSCSGGPFQVPGQFGIFADLYCAGNDRVYEFLEGVLGELLGLFPAPYIHLGGDETPRQRWRRCARCQSRMQVENLANPHALQAYFTNRIAAFLRARGRRAIIWNDGLHPALAPDIILQYWRGSRQALRNALRQGRPLIASGFSSTYLDHSYSFTSLRRAYAYQPERLSAASIPDVHLLGIEAPLWTEMVPTRARFDYQAFPRLTALAEVAWSPARLRQSQDFERRLSAFLPRLDQLGVGYAPLAAANPPLIKRLFGWLTILQAQTKTQKDHR